jgi:glycosyltransferase involved in cell wall biosynthesis
MNSASQPDLSIVIPFYNVEEFLPQCLESIIAQSIPNCEVILINDGSPDNCGNIAKDYAQRYPDLFRYIEQVNQGISVARNVGLDNSRGVYVTFLDSDDFLAESGLAELLQLAKDTDSDITVGNHWNFLADGSKRKNNAFVSTTKCSGEQWLRQCLRQRKYFPAPWGKILRRNFLVEKKLQFVPGQINEDQIYTVSTMLSAKSVSSADIPFYMYRYRVGSATRTWTTDRYRQSAESDAAITTTLFDICTNSCDGDLTKLVMNQCIKLLRKSFAPLYAVTSGNDPLIETTAERMDEIKLYRYLRIYRISHLVDWITLRLGFRNYLRWRARKIKPHAKILQE